MVVKDNLGFGQMNNATLADIKLSTGDESVPSLAATDGTSDMAEFKSKGPGARFTPRRRRLVGPTITINTRVPENLAGRFQRFCDENRLSYWEGIEELMHRAKI